MKVAVKMKVNSTPLLRLHLPLRLTAYQRPLVNRPSSSLLMASSPEGSHGVKNKYSTLNRQILVLLIASVGSKKGR